MAASEYDFFATGPRPAPSTGATASSSDHFGMSTAPAVPLQEQYDPSPAAPVVNQFGATVDEARPTGPLAAPGYGAVPVHGGLAAGYDDAPTAWDPSAAMGARAHSRAAVPVDPCPGAVLAAGIVATVLGGLASLAAVAIVLGYLGTKSQIDAALATSGSQVAGLDDLASSILTGILIAGVMVAVIAALYLFLGIATTRGHRWAAWVLVVLSGLSLVWSLWQVVSGGSSGATAIYSLGNWIGIGVTVTLLLLLTLGEGGRWLRRA